MDYFDARFLIESERRKDEIAFAAHHRLVKEAQQGGMKIFPFLSLSNVNFSPLAIALAHGLDRLGRLFDFWSCRLQSRYASVPLGASPESQASPCSS